MMPKNKKYVYFGIAAFPAVLCLIFICCAGVNLIFSDEWSMVVLAQKIEISGWSFADLFADFHGHRIFFPRLLYLSIAYLTDFNTVAQMIASFLMLILIVCITTHYIVGLQNVSHKRKCLFIALISFFICNYMQQENLLWGFQVGFIMVLLFQILSVYFIYLMLHTTSRKRRSVCFAAAIFAAVIASFSSMQGLLSWIIVAALFLLHSERKQLLPYIATWTVLAIIIWLIYFYNHAELDLYAVPHKYSDTSYVLHHPLNVIVYFLALTGNIIFSKLLIGHGIAIAGLLIIAFLFLIYIVFVKNKIQTNQYLFPVGLIMIGLLTTASIAAGRCDVGFEPLVLPSRYTSFSVYVIVGILLIWIELGNHENTAIIKNIANTFIVLLIFSIPVTMGLGLYNGIKKMNADKYLAYVLETFEIQPKEHIKYFNPEISKDQKRILSYINFLKIHQYHVFRNPAYKIPASLYCDSSHIENDEILQPDINLIQIASDRIEIKTPEVTPAYRHRITHLYLDVDGMVYPLYYKKYSAFSPLIRWLKRFDTMGKPEHDATSAILHASCLEPRQIKIKALATDGTVYVVYRNQVDFTHNPYQCK